MTGRFEIQGEVVPGRQVGRTIGFPTANIAAKTDWPRGVYVVDVFIDDDPAPRRGVMNVGTHPTVPGADPTIEAHILGYEGVLYGHTLRVRALHFIRPERKFDSLEALQAQLRLDRAFAKTFVTAEAAPPV